MSLDSALFLSWHLISVICCSSVEIKMNLTHSVDTELHDEPDMKPDEQPELKSKPHFEVKLVKGDKVTRFACSYVAPEPESPDSGK